MTGGGWVQLRQPRPREVKAKFARLPPHILEEMERRHDEWLETKRFFLQRVQDLQLPFNPLDEIIDGLGGPNAVAEMTGRKGRLIRQENEGVRFEARNASGLSAVTSMDAINIKERDMFQKGEKLVAIISEAASAGISLHAHRKAGNTRRRVHITLELPWSADKAVQQFGRSHRANQVQAPVYKLLCSNIGGETRFV